MAKNGTINKRGVPSIRNSRVLPNISRSIANQVMTFGQLVKQCEKHFSSKNHAENEDGGLVPDLSVFKEDFI